MTTSIEQIEFRGDFGATYRPIGRITLQEDTTYRNSSYETASNWTECLCPAQTVTLWCNGYWVMATFAGTRTDEYFVNRVFGSSSVAPKRSIGQDDTHVVRWYDYNFASLLDNDMFEPHLTVTLAPEYGLGSEPYKHDPSKLHHFITMPATGHPLKLTRTNPSGFDQVHTYWIEWRGEHRGEVMVRRSSGFNGDTTDVAYRQAVALLKGECP